MATGFVACVFGSPCLPLPAGRGTGLVLPCLRPRLAFLAVDPTQPVCAPKAAVVHGVQDSTGATILLSGICHVHLSPHAVVGLPFFVQGFLERLRIVSVAQGRSPRLMLAALSFMDTLVSAAVLQEFWSA